MVRGPLPAATADDTGVGGTGAGQGGVGRTGIAARIGRLLVLQISVISLAVVCGVFAIAYIVSDVLSRAALEGEAEHFWARYAQTPEAPLPDTDNMIGFLDRSGSGTTIPEALRRQPLGFGQVEFEGRQSLLHVSDEHQFNGASAKGAGAANGKERAVDGASRPPIRLYLIFRQEQVSRLTLYFGVIPGMVVLLLIYGLSYLTYRLSQQAISPLVRLARRLEAYDPRQPAEGTLDLSDLRRDADAETVTMIEALDRFAQRLEAFALREHEFARDASHELRTPLAVLGASLDLLERNGERSTRERECLQRMRQAVVHMQALTESLLLLSREEDIPVQPGGADLNLLVQEQIELLKDRARDTGNTIVLDQQPSIRIAAPDRLVSIAFSNLLANALNYTRDGQITVELRGDRLSVQDTGAGMSNEEVRRAFEPFFRGSALQREAVPGVGLGLAIVQRIADRLRWTTSIESTEHVGTRVTLTF